MNPTQSDVHVNKPLSSILVAFMQDEDKGAAKKIFPIVPVEHMTDQYYKWKREDFYRIQVAERAPGTPAEGGDINVATDSYAVKEYAIKKVIPDAIRANTDGELDLEQAATRWIGHQLMLKREKVFLSSFFTTGIWATDRAGVASGPTGSQFIQWDQASTSDPIQDIRKSIYDMEAATGYRPNKLLIGPHVERVLLDHPDLLDRIKYTQKGVVTLDLLASLLGLDEIVTSSLVENTAKEGQTESNAYVAGKSALLVYAPKSPSKLEPSAGYTFAWTKRFGNGSEGQRVKKFRNEDIESDVIEGQLTLSFKVVASDLGVFFSSVVA